MWPPVNWKAKRGQSRSGILPSYRQGALNVRMQRIVRWSLAVSVFLAVSYTLAYVPRWYRNVQRSGRLDPRPVRWEGGHLKSPPEPSWDAVRRWEDNLPQHNLSLPFPEGRNGRYVKFSTQPGGLGWNNVFTEL